MKERDKEKELHLATLLRARALKQAEKSGLPVFVYDEDHQKGATFGERFGRAFSELFEQGFDHVISIGNDTPELTWKHIQAAQEQLECESSQTNVVTGPSADGGVWLLGMSASVFEQAAFEELPWLTSRLREELENLYTCNTYDELLPELNDVDNFTDLRRILSKTYLSLSLQKLKIALQVFLSEEIEFLFNWIELVQRLFTNQAHKLRGPPVLK